MARSYGASATLRILKESAYGIKPNSSDTNPWEKFSFVSCDLSAEQALISCDLLGNGREPGVPFRDVIKDEGSLVVPVDARDFGRWLQFLLGDPVSLGVASQGSIMFSANPSSGDSVVINGVEFVFVLEEAKWSFSASSSLSSTATKEHSVQISDSLGTTLSSIVKALNTSTDPKIKCAKYTAVDGAKLGIVHKEVGPIGNNFTLEAKDSAISAGSINPKKNSIIVSGPTLSGGGYTHTFSSGAPTLPSFSLELGHTSIPAFFMHTGCMLNSMALSLSASGTANATLSVIAQNETRYKESVCSAPSSRAYKPFSQFNGQILRNGERLANVISADFTYSNGLETIQTIRSDGLIDGVDPSIISVNGSIEARFADTMLLSDAIKGGPIELKIGYKQFGLEGNSFSLVFTFHEVYLPRPKIPISGPGGVQTSFNWQAALNETVSKSVAVVLKNDVPSYVSQS